MKLFKTSRFILFVGLGFLFYILFTKFPGSVFAGTQTNPFNPTFASTCAIWVYSESDNTGFAYGSCDTSTTATSDGSGSYRLYINDNNNKKPPTAKTDYLRTTSDQFYPPSGDIILTTATANFTFKESLIGTYTGTGWKVRYYIRDVNTSSTTTCYEDSGYVTSPRTAWTTQACNIPADWFQQNNIYEAIVELEAVDNVKANVYTLSAWYDDVYLTFTYRLPTWNLIVNLTNPDPSIYKEATPLTVMQYNIFNVNATAKCQTDPPGRTCGTAHATVRYNKTGSVPNELISTTEGEIPFYIKDWWDLNYSYRMNITIDNTQNNNNLMNYQIPINISYDSNMQLDFDDLRFTWYNPSSKTQTELSYWIQNKSEGEWAYVWINVTNIKANDYTTIYVYYGNPSVTTTSNGTKTFVFYDDFSDGDISDWIKEGRADNPETGRIESRTDYYISPSYSMIVNVTDWCGEGTLWWTELWAKKNILASAGTYIVDFYTRLSGRYYFSAGVGYFQARVYADNTQVYMRPTTWGQGQGEITPLEWQGNNTTSFTVSGSFDLNLTSYSGDCSETRVWWDDVRIRRYSSPEPSTTIGSPESNIACSNMLDGQTCYFSWSINATGSSDWIIDVNFSSNSSLVPKNDTDNSFIRIVPSSPVIAYTVKMPSGYTCPSDCFVITAPDEPSANVTDGITFNASSKTESGIQPLRNGSAAKNQNGDAKPIFFIENTGTSNLNLLIRNHSSLPPGATLSFTSVCDGCTSAYGGMVTDSYSMVIYDLPPGRTGNISLWLSLVGVSFGTYPTGIYIRGELVAD